MYLGFQCAVGVLYHQQITNYVRENICLSNSCAPASPMCTLVIVSSATCSCGMGGGHHNGLTGPFVGLFRGTQMSWSWMWMTRYMWRKKRMTTGTEAITCGQARGASFLPFMLMRSSATRRSWWVSEEIVPWLHQRDKCHVVCVLHIYATGSQAWREIQPGWRLLAFSFWDLLRCLITKATGSSVPPCRRWALSTAAGKSPTNKNIRKSNINYCCHLCNRVVRPPFRSRYQGNGQYTCAPPLCVSWRSACKEWNWSWAWRMNTTPSTRFGRIHRPFTQTRWADVSFVPFFSFPFSTTGVVTSSRWRTSRSADATRGTTGTTHGLRGVSLGRSHLSWSHPVVFLLLLLLSAATLASSPNTPCWTDSPVMCSYPRSPCGP